MRIISLVPSLTETIAYTDLKPFLVGATNFCVSPRDLHRKITLIGGTKDPDLDKIKSLKPSHILVNEEENPKDQVDYLSKIAKIHSTFPKSLIDVPEMLFNLSLFLDNNKNLKDMGNKVQNLLLELSNTPINVKNKRKIPLFLYFIWKNPYMICGKDTYISNSLEMAGFKNAVISKDRYPTITVKELNTLNYQHIFLSSEPFPFRSRDLTSLKEEIATDISISKIDGKIFSWYGYTSLELAKTLICIKKNGFY